MASTQSKSPDDRRAKHIARVFIGSSTEGDAIASALQQLLEEAEGIQATHWRDGASRLTETFLESFTDYSDEYDYAVFVFRGDDVIISREQEYPATRDNVSFEAGFMMGKLGKSRVFLVVDNAQRPKIMSDLGGVAWASYDGKRVDSVTDDNGIRAALRPAATKIIRRIQSIERDHDGRTPPETLSKIVRGIMKFGVVQPIGKFPDVIKEINNRVLGDADSDKIRIMVDVMGYGKFSAPDLFEDYRHLLHKLSRNKNRSIGFIHLNDAQRLKIHAWQFESMRDRGELLKIKEKDAKFASRIAELEKETGKKCRNWEDFFTIIGESEKASEIEFQRMSREFYTTDDVMPLYLWIRDNKAAVFCIPNFHASPADETGFATESTGIIESLISIWERYAAESRKSKPPYTPRRG